MTKSACSCGNVRFVWFLPCNVLTFLSDANHDATLIQNQVLSSQPPSLQGYLNKYTNVAKGYNTRWFVLKDGVLSCKRPFSYTARIRSSS